MIDQNYEHQSSTPAGADSLRKYRAHCGGMELFRAYVERRNAYQPANLARKAEVIAAMTPKAGGEVPVDVFERAQSELATIQILEELDPVIQELLRFCENQPEDTYQLGELRLVLKIDDRHAPRDSLRIERRWEIEQRWIAAYLHMQDTGEYQSVNQIAKQIAESTSVTPRTAQNHWDAKKEREPHQAKWAKQIEDHARFLRTTRAKGRSIKSAVPFKPKKSKYRTHNL